MESPETIAEKYTLLREIGTGGMAQVFLACLTGLDGFRKLVVIKRILDHLSRDPHFVQMFLDEARTAANLRHPNIVDIYEVNHDEVSGAYFIAMEYLRGQDLKHIQQRAFVHKKGIPLSVAVQIIIDCARGLHYAHEKKDLRNRPMGIIHRDVSPRNIVVTYEGTTKLVDFGIAQAEGQRSFTDTGVVRGTVAYMSPEQASGKQLGPASDQWALGVNLFELTTGTRLYRAGGRGVALKTVVEGQIPPPSSRVAGYARRLEDIVLRTLARKPESRFPTCKVLADELEAFLTQEGLTASPARVGDYMKSVFADSYSEEEELSATLFDSIPTLISQSGHQTRAALRARRTNLPRSTNTFVGRDAELEELQSRFQEGAHLVTITGPPGTGKTRLALQFGQLRIDYDAPTGGVWLADLTETTSISGVLSALGQALGVELAGGEEAQIVEQLGYALDGRGPVLVMLDNFDRVVSKAADTLGRLLELAPDARFLVTSRERLGVSAEVLFELGPLGVPEADAAIETSEAVELFLDRARAVKPGFEVKPGEEAVIAQVVRKLDGIPLAIELAAARLRVFTPRNLLERLEKRFDLLASGRRDTTGRQVTLYRAIDWSWETLSEPEQAALRQAAIFRGGFTIAAAEAVIDLSAAENAPWIPDVIQSLCDKSLLRSHAPAELPDELRFSMYESIREFVAEKLAASGQEDALRERHARYYLDLSEDLVSGIHTHGGTERFLALGLELENLLAVHRWSVPDSTTSADAALRVIRTSLAIEPVGSVRGSIDSLQTLVDLAVKASTTEGVDPIWRTRALLIDARAHRLAGRLRQAREQLEIAEPLARQIGDDDLIGQVLLLHGVLDDAQGRPEAEAREHFEEAVACLRRVDSPQRARALNAFAVLVHHLGRMDESRRLYEEALAEAREIGDQRQEGVCLANLGLVLQAMGELEHARKNYEEALEIQRRRGNRRSEANALGNLSTLLHDRGKTAEAKALCEEALEIFREVGDRRFEGIGLGYLGSILADLGQFDAALRRLQEAQGMLADIGARSLWGITRGFQGRLHQERGQLEEAAKVLENALETLEEIGDHRYVGLFRAHLGAIQAELGELTRADATFTYAAATVQQEKDPYINAAVDVLRGVLDLRRARDDGNVEEIEKVVADLRDRVEALGVEDENGDSLLNGSHHLRVALRCLERVLSPEEPTPAL